MSSSVARVLEGHGEELSAADVSALAGLARVTARRYLEHLTEEGRVELTKRYAELGPARAPVPLGGRPLTFPPGLCSADGADHPPHRGHRVPPLRDVLRPGDPARRRCVAAGCPALYHYDDPLTGRRFMGCLHKVFATEIDVELFQAAERTRGGFGAVKLAGAPLRRCQFHVERAFEPPRASLRQPPLLRLAGRGARRGARVRPARPAVKDPLHGRRRGRIRA